MHRSRRLTGSYPRAAAHLVTAAFAITALLGTAWAGPAMASTDSSHPRSSHSARPKTSHSVRPKTSHSVRPKSSRSAHPQSTHSHPAASSTPSHPGWVKYYIVQPPQDGKKEFLFEIAAKTLGDGSLAPEIFKLNKGRLQPGGGRLESENLVLPGWILVLPASAHGAGVHDGPLPVVLPSPLPSATPAAAARPRVSGHRAAASTSGGLTEDVAIGGAALIALLLTVGMLIVRQRRAKGADWVSRPKRRGAARRQTRDRDSSPVRELTTGAAGMAPLPQAAVVESSMAPWAETIGFPVMSPTSQTADAADVADLADLADTAHAGDTGDATDAASDSIASDLALPGVATQLFRRWTPGHDAADAHEGVNGDVPASAEAASPGPAPSYPSWLDGPARPAVPTVLAESAESGGSAAIDSGATRGTRRPSTGPGAPAAPADAVPVTPPVPVAPPVSMALPVPMAPTGATSPSDPVTPADRVTPADAGMPADAAMPAALVTPAVPVGPADSPTPVTPESIVTPRGLVTTGAMDDDDVPWPDFLAPATPSATTAHRPASDDQRMASLPLIGAALSSPSSPGQVLTPNPGTPVPGTPVPGTPAPGNSVPGTPAPGVPVSPDLGPSVPSPAVADAPVSPDAGVPEPSTPAAGTTDPCTAGSAPTDTAATDTASTDTTSTDTTETDTASTDTAATQTPGTDTTAAEAAASGDPATDTPASGDSGIPGSVVEDRASTARASLSAVATNGSAVIPDDTAASSLSGPADSADDGAERAEVSPPELNLSPIALRILGAQRSSARLAEAADVPVQRHQVGLGDDRIDVVLAEAPAAGHDGKRRSGHTWLTATPYLVWTPLPYDSPDDGVAFACLGAGDEGCLFIDLSAAPGTIAVGGDHAAAIRLAESIAHQLSMAATAGRPCIVIVVGDVLPEPLPPGAIWVDALRDLASASPEGSDDHTEIVFCELRSNEDAFALARYVGSAQRRVVPIVLANLPSAPWTFTSQPSLHPSDALHPALS
jgi:hypothetical protein